MTLTLPTQFAELDRLGPGNAQILLADTGGLYTLICGEWCRQIRGKWIRQPDHVQDDLTKIPRVLSKSKI